MANKGKTTKKKAATKSKKTTTDYKGKSKKAVKGGNFGAVQEKAQ
ncbi:hypothetical protein [Caudoviricetes sp.]|nr:hypothetical protein [Caudoviricetes sp.]UOF79119.1 hypothetical protein [Caudoviricetes sp.]